MNLGDSAAALAHYAALQRSAAALPPAENPPPGTANDDNALVLRNLSHVANATLAAALAARGLLASGATTTTTGLLLAAELLREASDRQTTWPYFEPPLWHAPTAQCEGAAWLRRGAQSAKDAELAFKKDLATFPERAPPALLLEQPEPSVSSNTLKNDHLLSELASFRTSSRRNGWSLSGLRAAMALQPEKYDSAALAALLERQRAAWKDADLPLASPCPLFG